VTRKIKQLEVEGTRAPVPHSWDDNDFACKRLIYYYLANKLIDWYRPRLLLTKRTVTEPYLLRRGAFDVWVDN